MPTTPPNNNTGLYGSSASSPSIPTNNTSGLYGIDNGAVYINNDVVADQISANSIVSNTITTTGNVTVGGTLIGNVLGDVTGSVTGNVTGNFAGGNITADYATINNDLTVVGTIYGNISGNISGNIIVPGGNTEILFNNNGNAGASNNFTFDDAVDLMTLQGDANITGTADLGNLIVKSGGNIDMGLNIVGNVNDPIAGTDAATKNYVDSQLSSDIFVVTDGVTSVGVAKGETVTFEGTVNETTVFVTNSNNQPIVTVGLPNDVDIAGNLSAAGNVTGNYILGNGALLTGVSTSLSGNLQGNLIGNGFGLSNAAFITSTGNITGNYILGNGSQLTGIATSLSGNLQGNLLGNGFGISNVTFLTSVGNISTSGNVISNATVFANTVAAGGGGITSTGAITALSSIVSLGNIQAVNNISTTAGNIASANNITANGAISAAGNVTGNNVIGTYLWGDGSNITGVVAGSQSVQISVKNTSGGTLSKGTPVYPTGTVGAGTTLEVAAARADTPATMPAIGLLESTLTNNATGYAISVGSLQGINTSSYSIGTILYVAAAGGFTNVRPDNGYLVQPIGTVGRVNVNTGTLDVNIWNYLQLPNLGAGNIWYGNANSVPQEVTLATFTGNIGAGNLVVTHAISAAGNVTAGNVITSGSITSGPLEVTGNVNVTGNVIVTGNLNYSNVTDLVVGDPLVFLGANNTGNVYDLGFIVTYDDGLDQHGGFVRDASDGTWKIFGNVVAEPTTTVDFTNAIYQPLQIGSLLASTTVTANGNLSAANISTVGSVSATGNITGNYILGNGSQLTGLPENYSNANVANYLPTYTGNLAGSRLDITTGNTQWTIAGNTITSPGGGSWISDENNLDEYITSAANGYIDLQSLYANSAIASEIHLEHGLAHISLDPQGNGQYWTFYSNAAMTAPGAISAVGNITGNYFIGNGSQLTGIQTGLAGNMTGNINGQGYHISNLANASIANGGNLKIGTVTLINNSVSPATLNINGVLELQDVTIFNGDLRIQDGNGVNFYDSDNSNYVGLKGPSVIPSNVEWTLPAADGTSAQVLSTYGNGILYWANAGSSYGNSNVANFLANYGSNTISTTGNITAGNIIGNISVSGTVSAAANVIVRVKNITGSTIAAGKLVSANVNSGFTYIGLVTEVALADRRYAAQMPAIAITTESIAAGATGNAMVSGTLPVTNYFEPADELFVNTDGDASITPPNGDTNDITQRVGSVGMSDNYDTGWYFINIGDQVRLPNLGTGNTWLGVGNVTTQVTAYGNANVVANLAALGTNPISTSANISAANLIANTGLRVNAVNYTGTDGTNGQVLTTYGNGVTYFSTVSGGGGGGSNIANGTSNISINTANGNATVGIGGTANTTVFHANGLTTLTVTTSGNSGNITGVNVYVGNQIQGQAANSAVTIKNYKDAAFTVTYASTITPDVSNGSLQTVTLTGNVTFSAFTNPQAGQSLILIVKQDSTGNRLLTSTMKFAGNIRTLSTGANAIDIISCFYDGSTYYATLSNGYA